MRVRRECGRREEPKRVVGSGRQTTKMNATRKARGSVWQGARRGQETKRVAGKRVDEKKPQLRVELGLDSSWRWFLLAEAKESWGHSNSLDLVAEKSASLPGRERGWKCGAEGRCSIGCADHSTRSGAVLVKVVERASRNHCQLLQGGVNPLQAQQPSRPRLRLVREP